MHALIFANGTLPHSPLPLPAHDLVIAADGGAQHLARYALQPDVLIGDLDSLEPGAGAGFEQAGVEILRHPADKDQTDLELALDLARARGCTRVTLYGLFGGRWDMTFANALLLASPKYRDILLEVRVGDTRIHVLRGGQTLELTGKPGDLVSVLPVSGPAEGVTYRGLAWPLEDADLPLGSPRGISNRLTDRTGFISLRNGTVFVVCSSDSSGLSGSTVPPKDQTN